MLAVFLDSSAGSRMSDILPLRATDDDATANLRRDHHDTLSSAAFGILADDWRF